ncbi:histidine kinase N-terminal 7TM domain-containing protein [Natronorubrum daqingense]|uniref:histidine kinase n=1 Tax=Natronorubrum daqingense TaxID=588898 RepID=A0A1N7EDM2_9EURY|nr:histidine kinase N-terminal 7TM domain-containing protein [Natronorubrum daqingense]APX96512.1 hypothetical protein BB347_07715 [Natronorubrum daqingense]SIR86191.1 PAS/PAC sensor signal transduction histidine kinase [Natronorubrum daqingense]
MVFGHNAMLVIYAAATLVGLVLGVYLLQYRDKPGVVPLAGSLFATAFLSGPVFVATASDSHLLSSLMIRLLFVGVCTSVLFIFLFSLEYTGREHLVTPKTVGLLSIHPVVVVALAVTNPGNVFFATFEYNPAAPTDIYFEPGVAFVLHTLYSYLLLACVTVLILEFLYSTRGLYRGQALALFGATTIPWLANMVYIFGLVSYDTTPIGYILTGVLYTVAIVRYQFIDVAPIARNRVVDTVSEGVFVIDHDNHLIDVNPAGCEMLAVDSASSAIGHNVHTLFKTNPAIVDMLEELTETPVESTTEFSLEDRHFEIQATPITDGRDRHVGWLILVYDITTRKRRESELERQNERLDRFADLVSHDLRNPLSVASGYLDIARDTEDEADTAEYLDRVERSHERMEAIVDDVLTLARGGATVTEPQPVDVAALARRAWNSVETDNATLEVHSREKIVADPTRFQRLFENLFRNAVEHGIEDGDSHTPENGVTHHYADEPSSESPDTSTELTVTVALEDAGTGEPVLTVEDDGRGIPSSIRERIFEEGVTTAETNTGLGLRIVEQLAQAHGWSITVATSSTGGARFELRGIDRDVSGSRESPSEFTSSGESRK